MTAYRNAPLAEGPRQTWWERMVAACKRKHDETPTPSDGLAAELRRCAEQARSERLERAWPGIRSEIQTAAGDGKFYSLVAKEPALFHADRLRAEGFLVEQYNDLYVLVKW